MQKSTRSTFRFLSLTLALALTASLVMVGTLPSLIQQEAFAKAFREAPTEPAQQQQFDPNTILIPQGAADQEVPSGNYYQPINATVPSGATVTWVNQDTAPHTATSGNPRTGPSGIFDTGFISAGQSASVTITSEAGTTIPYYCTIHPWMVGNIIVVGAGQQQKIPPTQQQQQQPTDDTQVAANATQQQQQTLNRVIQSLQQAVQSLQQAIDNLEQLAGGGQAPTTVANATTTQQQPPRPTNETQAAQRQQQQTIVAQTAPNFFDEWLAQNERPVPNVTTEFPGKEPEVNQMLSPADNTDTGFEQEHENNWLTPIHDIYGTRWSNQTVINKDNVDQLEVKWIFSTTNRIEDPPVVVGNRAYVQDNGGVIYAFNLDTGLNLWKIDTGSGGLMHGMVYDNGVLFAGTGHNGTVVAVNPDNGEILWESPVLGPTDVGFNIPAIPLVWEDVVIAGSAGGDLPTYPGVVQGNVTALNRTNGEILWSTQLTAGDWVSPEMIPPNGGGTAWSSFAFDPATGLLYVPVGNATPDFNARTRVSMPNFYTNHVMAIDIRTGEMRWATPFVAAGTVIEGIAVPDTHDWDVSFGVTIANAELENGTVTKIVIGHDKMGNVIAMDARTGEEIWWKTLGTIYRPNAIPLPNGSGLVFPAPGDGVENWIAADEDTAYVPVASMGANYFVEGLSGHAVPIFNATESGYGNSTLYALDLDTGETKWEFPSDFPNHVGALVTNDVVFTGHMTPIGVPYEYGTFGNPSQSPMQSSGILVALDKETGEKLWDFNVGAAIGIGGPSVAQGLLFIPTGSIHVSGAETGNLVVFGLPAEEEGETLDLEADAGFAEDAVIAGTEEQQKEQEEEKTIEIRATEVDETYRWAIDDKINPTITLVANANNTIIVGNPTNEVHELIIENADGQHVAATEDIEPSSIGQLSINPNATMDASLTQYYCEYHPKTMRGDINVRDSSS